MTMAKIVGEYAKTIDGYDVHKWTTGYAYGRNGNAHNPTPRVCWVVYKNGQPQGQDTTLRGAKELIALLMKNEG